MWPYLQGIAIGGGLIIAIGAQNAFVLSQGIRRNYALQTAVICSLCDAVLILAGVSGIGRLIAASGLLTRLASWLGALFLLWYGSRSFCSALRGGRLEDSALVITSRRKMLLMTLALTLLNPHVYIDTIILIGGISGQLAAAERLQFAGGAMTASVLWFFSLSLGAGLLAPLFRSRLAWRCLDGLVCLMMWSIALSLLWPQLRQLSG
ncbi:LysE/ArgO family amino acid transporter [Pelobacter seleniigenes]|uniref:LysE/ArgO family amino acid transporter n=1 Tax=Pelobacter seleniigenes TaxID=407188 RepID=UPI0004A6B9B5|nr:LysE family transporter [Pelobacter seleniigenes]